MINRLSLAISISTIALFLIFAQPTSANPEPNSAPPSFDLLQPVITHTLYLPIISMPPPACNPLVAGLILQPKDISDYNYDSDNSGPINLQPHAKKMGAVAGCYVTYIHADGIFSYTPIVLNQAILFEDTAGAKAYLTYRRQELMVMTDTHQIEMPLIGQESLAFHTSADPFKIYAIEFRKGVIVVGMSTAGWAKFTPFTDTLTYARIVEAKLPN